MPRLHPHQLAWIMLVAMSVAIALTISSGTVIAQECSTVTIIESEDGEVRLTGDISSGETVTITAIGGLADADITVNSEPINLTDANGEVRVVVPNNAELMIVVKSESSEYEIHFTRNETGTEVSSSVISKSGSSMSSSMNINTVCTSTSASTSTIEDD